jgi:hypothetical protein
MDHINPDQLRSVRHIENPGIPIIKLGDHKFIVHDRNSQEWVLSGSYSTKPNREYSLIERTCDCIEFILDFGVELLLMQGAYAIKNKVRDAFLEYLS